MKKLVIKTEKTVNYTYKKDGLPSIPTIFLHGFTGSHHSWDEVVMELNDTVITLDIPGHGKSYFKNIDINYDIDDWCEDFQEVLRSLNISKMNLCGYSMGGRLAIAFSSKYPEMINKLILESASYGIENKKDREERLKADLEICSIIESDLALFIENWENNKLFSKQEGRNPEMFLKQRNQRLSSNPMQLSKALKSFSQGNMGYYLKNISKFKFPIIIINGVEDDKYVNLGRQLDTFSRSSKQHIILECGHNVHFEK